MALKIYTKTGDKGKTALIGGTKVPKSHIRIESYGTVDELNSFIGLLGDQLAAAAAGLPETHTAIAPSVLSVPIDPSMTASQASSPLSTDSSPHHSFTAPLTTDPSSLTPSSTSTSIPKPQNPSIPKSPPASPLPNDHSPITFPSLALLLKEIQDRLFTVGSSLACDPDKAPQLKIPDLKEEDVQLLEKEMDKMNEVLPPMKSFVLPGGHVAVSTAHIARCVCRRAERLCVHMQDNELFIDPLVLKYLNRLSDYLFMLARYAGHMLNIAELPWKPRV